MRPRRTAFLPLLAALLPGALLAEPPAEADSVASHRIGTVPPVEAVVVVHEFGEFRVRFYRDEVPNHVAYFLTLAGAGYFDQLAVHRVIPRLLIQSGDASTRRMPAPPAEGDEPPPPPPDPPPATTWRVPPSDGPGRTHRRGTFSLAWTDETGVAGPQWFVALEDVPALDEYGTVIGELVSGMEIVEKIAQISTFRDRRPVNRVEVPEIRIVAEAPGPESPEDAAGSSGDVDEVSDSEEEIADPAAEPEPAPEPAP